MFSYNGSGSLQLKFWRSKGCSASQRQPRATLLIVWKPLHLLLCTGAQATSHTFWAAGCSSQPGTHWCCNFSASRRAWHSLCATEGDCSGLPTHAYLLDAAGTINAGKADLGVKIKKYFGHISCTAEGLWLSSDTGSSAVLFTELSWLIQLLPLLTASTRIWGDVAWTADAAGENRSVRLLANLFLGQYLCHWRPGKCLSGKTLSTADPAAEQGSGRGSPEHCETLVLRSLDRSILTWDFFFVVQSIL